MQRNKLTHLKIKIKYLNEESRIIRQEERKALRKHKKKNGGLEKQECSGVVLRKSHEHGSWDFGQWNNSEGCRCSCARYIDMRSHRTGTLRYHLRAHMLAYGFLRGIPYSKIEPKADTEKNCYPPFGNAKNIARRFNPTWSEDEFENRWDIWYNNAFAYLHGEVEKEVEKEVQQTSENNTAKTSRGIFPKLFG